MIGARAKRKVSGESEFEGDRKVSRIVEEAFTPQINYEKSPLPSIEVEESDDNHSAYDPHSARLAKRNSLNRTYGLRPRADLRKPSYDCDADDKEIIRERRSHRGRGRSSLMTKYRRRTANDRERHRMKEINDAFTTLRGILPTVYTKRSSQVSMTKIRILKLAASYIEALSNLLSEGDTGLEDGISGDLEEGGGASKCLEGIEIRGAQPFASEECSRGSGPTAVQFPSLQNSAYKDQPLNESIYGNDVQLNVTTKDAGWGGVDPSPSDREIISLLEEVTGLEDSNARWHNHHQSLDELCFSLT